MTSVFSANLAFTNILCFSGNPEKFNEASSTTLSLTVNEPALTLASHFSAKSSDQSMFLPTKLGKAKCSIFPSLVAAQTDCCFSTCQFALILAISNEFIKSNERPSMLPLNDKFSVVGLSMFTSPCTLAVNSPNIIS